MARLIYGLSGEGRGHTSRAMAVTDALRRRGHEVRYCCGGTARGILEEYDEHVIPVPALQHDMEDNCVQILGTIRRNWPSLIGALDTIDRLTEIFSSYDPDLVVTDFEAFSPRAATRLDVPVLSFNHQQVVTETEYEVSPENWIEAALARAVIRLIAPREPTHTLLTSFYYPPLKHPHRATLIPPIIREEVRSTRPHHGKHVLVYYNHGEGAEGVLRSLRATDHRYVIYGFPRSEAVRSDAHLEVKEPSIQGFLEDLAASRAVICTAGFTLMSEALYLGKPLLVVPNEGIFEQTLNARFLERDGLGERVAQQDLDADVVDRFLDRTERYRSRLAELDACGNAEAIACIEETVNKVTPKSFALTP